jgi:ankyrin repeat protein
MRSKQKAAGEAESFDSSPNMFEVNESDRLGDYMTRVAEQLLNACKQGNIDEVRTLVQGGVDVNIDFKDGSTPLTKAVETESVRLTELLLRAGARVDDVNRYGETAFGCAVRHGYMDMAALLLSANADVNIKQGDDETPLMNALGFKTGSQK